MGHWALGIGHWAEEKRIFTFVYINVFISAYLLIPVILFPENING
jgi:hypothetical protein